MPALSAMSGSPTIVLALGGNALQDPRGDDSVESDFNRTMQTAAVIAELVATRGIRPVITHGNGPQVGNHLLRAELAHAHGHLPPLPLDVCVADTQGGMGYMLQQCLTNAFAEAGVPAVVGSIVTQTVVHADDPAFDAPSKPVGELIEEDRVAELEERGWKLREDRHRGGWRRVVASPDPVEIVEAGAIKALVDQGTVVIAAGGGGIPVVQDAEGRLHGVAAVVDKDLASALLAVDLGSDGFVMVTDVDGVYLDLEADGEPLSTLPLAEARAMLASGVLPAGSMGPKVEAAARFVETTGRPAIITSLAQLVAALRSEGGTRIVA